MSVRTPSYRRHKPTGQAVVTIDGRDFYLGKYGSLASRAEYDRLIAEWLAGGRRLSSASDGGGQADLTVSELLLAFLRFADGYYRKGGQPTGEADNIRYAVRPLRRLYGHTPAAQFGPLALKAVRQDMIDSGLCRNEVNRRTRYVTRVFAWGVENELVPAAVHHGLKAVAGLRKDRSEARESEPVKPVPEAFVAAIRPHVARQVWVMVELQRLTGMRPGEVCRMRTCDLDTSGRVWVYTPERHKTEHHGRERPIYLGPRAQEVLRPWLRADPAAHLFSPIEAQEERWAEQRRNRRSPMTPSHRARTRKAKPRRKPRDRYDANSYRHAVAYGCRKAGIPPWHPNQLRHNRLVTEAGSPGSEMVPAASALLSLLALKLLDKERRSHIDDFNCDEALDPFAGLNILPKKSFATDYSYRTVRAQQLSLLQGWVKALAPVMSPAAEGFALDFHPIPYRGDPAGLDRHYLPRRGKAGPSVLTSFAREQTSRCLCYANANLARADRNGELMRFVEFWRGVASSDPKWLYFDSKVVDSPELSRVNQRKIHFVTIRRRGAAILRGLERQPASAWTKAVIDIPKRCHTQVRYLEEAVRLRGYEGPIRRIAVTGLGRDRPTLFLSHPFEETPRELIIRYAGRNRIEDGLGISVNFFHLDCLASEVRLNVDLDAALTVIANGCYRWLASRLGGFAKADPKQLSRRFVATAGTVTIQNDRLSVTFDRRSQNPILREADLDRDSPPIPWLGQRRLVFSDR